MKPACPCRRWVCLLDRITFCRVRRICDAHDRNITKETA